MRVLAYLSGFGVAQKILLVDDVCGENMLKLWVLLCSL